MRLMDVLFPVDRPSPIVAIIIASLNAAYLAWGANILGSSSSCIVLSRIWLGIGVGCAAVNMLFVCWFVWHLQQRVTRDLVPEAHNIFRVVVMTPAASALYFTAGLVVEVLWMIFAMQVHDGKFAAMDDGDTCSTSLPVGVSVLCCHWFVLIGALVLSVMTECGKMPRWRARLLARIIRHREAGSNSSASVIVGDEIDDDVPPFTPNLAKSKESQRLQSQKSVPVKPQDPPATREILAELSISGITTVPPRRVFGGGVPARAKHSTPLPVTDPQQATADGLVAHSSMAASPSLPQARTAATSSSKYLTPSIDRKRAKELDDDEELPDFV